MSNKTFKIILIVIMLLVGLVTFSACGNRQVGIDTAQSFNRAYIKLGGEWKEVTVKSWRDFNNGDEVQIVTTDGTVYLSHYSNMVLVSKK